MGSKKKTVRQASYSKMMDNRDNLMAEHMWRTFSRTKTSDSAVMGRSLLDINRTFNWRGLDKVGMVAHGNIETVTVDDTKAYNAISDPNKTSVAGVSNSRHNPDAMGHHYADTHYGQRQYVNNKWMYDIGGTFMYIFNISTYEGDNGEILSIAIEYKDDSGAYHKDNGIVYDYIITEISYNRSDGIVGSVWVEADSIGSIAATGYSVTAIPYKYNFTINNERGIKIANAQLGLPQRTPSDTQMTNSCESTCRYKYDEGTQEYIDCMNECQDTSGDTLEDALINTDYKHIFFLYCVPYKEPYVEIIEELFAGEQDSKYQFETYGVVFECTRNEGLAIDGVSVSSSDPDNDEKQYIIPNEFMLGTDHVTGRPRFNMPDKFKLLHDSFTMVMMAEKTVKVKWYQTGIFKILSVVVTIVIAVVTGNPTALIAYMGATVASKILPSDIMMVVGIVASLYGGYSAFTSAAATYVDIMVNIVKIVESITKAYLNNAMGKLTTAYEQGKKEYETVVDELEELTNLGFAIWSPMTDMTNGYDKFYDIMYNLTDAPYSYDKYFNLNTRALPYG